MSLRLHASTSSLVTRLGSAIQLTTYERIKSKADQNVALYKEKRSVRRLLLMVSSQRWRIVGLGKISFKGNRQKGNEPCFMKRQRCSLPHCGISRVKLVRHWAHSFRLIALVAVMVVAETALLVWFSQYQHFLWRLYRVQFFVDRRSSAAADFRSGCYCSDEEPLVYSWGRIYVAIDKIPCWQQRTSMKVG